MRVARAPWIPAGMDAISRYVSLLMPAVDEALAGAGLALGGASPRLGLVLALPAPRPGRPPDLADALLDCMQRRYPSVFEAAQTFEVGHAAGHLALDAAGRGFAAGAFDVCLLCGVDSYLAPETLAWVEACEQLHGGGPLNNAWGFIPGEAAGTVLVGSSAFTRRHGLSPLAEIGGVGIGRERSLIKTRDVCIGEGLTQAFRAALQALAPGECIDNVFCDLNGEPYRADEYGFTTLRTGACFRAASEFVAPADCWGDVGAASALLYIALAAVAHRKRYAKGALSLVWASSESGERGAALVRGSDPHRG
ncbi:MULTISPECIES: hypothetical protein [unclassified Variovorax]|uniref:hypothetical protein n=1 Tax=unclassified Variovorax TaxID=663243 RepID=UPI003F45CF67